MALEVDRIECSVLQVRSKRRMPDTSSIDRRARSTLRDRVWREFLGEDSELRAILVHADVRAAHAPLSVERRAPVQDAVIVHHFDCGQRGHRARENERATHPPQSRETAAPSTPSRDSSAACTTYGEHHTCTKDERRSRRQQQVMAEYSPWLNLVRLKIAQHAPVVVVEADLH